MVLRGLGCACGCLVVGVDEAAESGAVAADDDDGLADPALEVGNVPTVGPAEGVDDVDEVRAEVAQHVDEARGGAEGHGHGGVLDEAQGLGVQGVPEEGIAGAGRQGGGVDLVVGLGVDRGQLVAGGAGGGGDGRVRGAERGGAVARVAARVGARGGAGAQGGRVDEDEELGLGKGRVGEVGEDGLGVLVRASQ